jgi:hypothetical protein
MAAVAKPVLSVGTDVIFSRLLGLECHYGANFILVPWLVVEHDPRGLGPVFPILNL